MRPQHHALPSLSVSSLPAVWYIQFLRRLQLHWFLKGIGTTAFMAIFFYSYFTVLHQPIAPVQLMPLTLADEWVAFWAPAFYPYASLWLYTALVPALQPSLLRFLGYGCGIGMLCLIGLVLFLFFPTAVPFSAMDWFNNPSLKLLRAIDMTGNACPSLHVGAALFSAFCLQRLLTEMRCPTWLIAFSWVWCAVIIYSTMAIKQHVMWDVVAGMLLACLVYAVYAPFERKLDAAPKA